MFFEVLIVVLCKNILIKEVLMSKDLICEGDGIIMDTSHITLDCRNHKIINNASGTVGNGIYMFPRKDSLTVKNCEIIGFNNGIYSIYNGQESKFINITKLLNSYCCRKALFRSYTL